MLLLRISATLGQYWEIGNPALLRGGFGFQVR